MSEPFAKFTNWFEQAQAKPEIVEPSAMCLSTVDEENCPSSRMILLKKFDERGFSRLVLLPKYKNPDPVKSTIRKVSFSIFPH